MKKLTLLFLSLCAAIAASASVKVVNLKTDGKINPLGLDNLKPLFSWQITSTKNDLLQQGYEIEVASTPQELKKGKNLLWSKRVERGAQSTLNIPYEGTPLASRQTCYWRVRSLTNQGVSSWSEPALWSMGLLQPGDWKASWIGRDKVREGEGRGGNGARTRLSARYIRVDVPAEKPIEKATLYICGLGLYEAHINGSKVGNDEMAPTVSLYSSRVYYNTYDVTSMLQQGHNVLGVILGNGRYFRMRNSEPFFGLPRLKCQIEVTYTDGTQYVDGSSHLWRVSDQGPIRENNEFDGEKYDARMELKGWDTPGFNDTEWEAADEMEAPAPVLQAQPNPNITVQDELHPLTITRRDNGNFMVDMGQNMVGRLRITGVGKAGVPVKMVFAETLQLGGDLYLANIRTAQVTDVYTPATDGTFTWEPLFTYHGFRYVEISGLQAQPQRESLTGRVLYDRMASTGTIDTYLDITNQIIKNAWWGIRSNYRGMPTDCPQRDERQGWLGDRATGCAGEAFLFDNEQLYLKWLQDIEDSQNEQGSISDVSPRYWTLWNDDVTWPSAYFMAAAMLERQYGNTQGIIRHYPSMRKWIEHIASTAMQEGIVTKDTYGDWCMPPESAQLIHSQDPARKTDGAILSTTVFYSLLNLMSHFAQVASQPQDVAEYENLAAQIKEAYNKKFYDYKSGNYGNGTVTANLLSLQLGLVPMGEESKVFNNIVDKTQKEYNGHMSVGVLGIQHIMRALTRHNRPELSYQLFANSDYPSWGYMAREGATTTWELWNGNTADPAMNSGNHVMLLGDLLIWLYEDVAGIKCEDTSTGMQRLEMKPAFEMLAHVKATYNTVNGVVKSEWRRSNGHLTWQVTIPGNVTARVMLPLWLSHKKVTPSGKGGIHSTTPSINGCMVVEVGSGSYTFEGDESK